MGLGGHLATRQVLDAGNCFVLRLAAAGRPLLDDAASLAGTAGNAGTIGHGESGRCIACIDLDGADAGAFDLQALPQLQLTVADDRLSSIVDLYLACLCIGQHLLTFGQTDAGATQGPTLRPLRGLVGICLAAIDAAESE
ncbi:hypothetical protein D9M69_342860 [compost metagenome]